MAYFLAGVARAEILDGNQLFATAKTLIDSSITIGISAEDVRVGKGAALAGKYFHSATFDLKMSDGMFKLEYIAANIGSKIDIGGDAMVTVQATASSGITLPTTAQSLTGDKIYAYAAPVGSDAFATYEVTANKITGMTDGEYCVKYLQTYDLARKITVNGNFVPKTLYVILTASLFSGDSNNPSTGTEIGKVVIKVPRFLLAGSQELSMSMTGASTTAFEGSALIANAQGCDGDGYYAEILEILTDSRWYDNVKNIIIEDNDVTADVGAVSITPDVYAIYTTDARPKKITNVIIDSAEAAITEALLKSSLVFSTTNSIGLSVHADTGVITGTATAGTAIIKVVAKIGTTAIEGLEAVMIVNVTA
jgi:hypothetical protein